VSDYEPYEFECDNDDRDEPTCIYRADHTGRESAVAWTDGQVVDELNSFRKRCRKQRAEIERLRAERDNAVTKADRLQFVIERVISAFDDAPLNDTWWISNAMTVLEYLLTSIDAEEVDGV
jgi:hypothetical protein